MKVVFNLRDMCFVGSWLKVMVRVEIAMHVLLAMVGGG